MTGRWQTLAVAIVPRQFPVLFCLVVSSTATSSPRRRWCSWWVSVVAGDEQSVGRHRTPRYTLRSAEPSDAIRYKQRHSVQGINIARRSILATGDSLNNTYLHHGYRGTTTKDHSLRLFQARRILRCTRQDLGGCRSRGWRKETALYPLITYVTAVHPSECHELCFRE